MVDNRVYISPLLLKIKRKLRPGRRLKLQKVVDPTFNVYIIVLCPENTLNDAQLYIEFLALTTCVHTGDRHGFSLFFNLLDFCTRDTLLQKTDKIDDTGSKSASYH